MPIGYNTRLFHIGCGWLHCMIRTLVLLLLLLLPKTVLSEVIVNSEVSLESLSKQYLLSIFSMRTRTWPDGMPVRVFILPPYQDKHRLFVKQSLGVFPYQLSNIWDRTVFSGAGQSPITVNSEAEMLQRVSQTKGAIGYVMTSIQGGLNVKVITIK